MEKLFGETWKSVGEKIRIEKLVGETSSVGVKR